MSETMIEGLARALMRQKLLKVGHLPGPAMDAAIDAEWREFVVYADVALEALRTPTGAMLSDATLIAAMGRDAERVWSAMIAGALADRP